MGLWCTISDCGGQWDWHCVNLVTACSMLYVVLHGKKSLMSLQIFTVIFLALSPYWCECFILAKFPAVCNSLPAAVCEADSLYSFKLKLKTHLFTLCFNHWLFVFTNFCNCIPGHNSLLFLTYLLTLFTSWGYRGGSPTAVQAWQPCPLWEPSPSHPILV